MTHTIAALLDDLAGSGLLDTTLVVMTGEFGGTPVDVRAAKGEDYPANGLVADLRQSV